MADDVATIDSERPVIVWFRDDLRLADNPALNAAASSGRKIICIFLHDEESAGVRPLGGAAISAAWNGRVWAGFVRPDGTVYMSAVAPRASAPDPDTWTNEMFSGTARYLAAN